MADQLQQEIVIGEAIDPRYVAEHAELALRQPALRAVDTSSSFRTSTVAPLHTADVVCSAAMRPPAGDCTTCQEASDEGDRSIPSSLTRPCTARTAKLPTRGTASCGWTVSRVDALIVRRRLMSECVAWLCMSVIPAMAAVTGMSVIPAMAAVTGQCKSALAACGSADPSTWTIDELSSCGAVELFQN